MTVQVGGRAASLQQFVHGPDDPTGGQPAVWQRFITLSHRQCHLHSSRRRLLHPLGLKACVAQLNILQSSTSTAAPQSSPGTSATFWVPTTHNMSGMHAAEWMVVHLPPGGHSGLSLLNAIGGKEKLLRRIHP